MRVLLYITIITMFSCGQSLQDKKFSKEEEKAKSCEITFPAIGEKIQGDFDGDGKVDYASSVKTKEAIGNPVEEGTSDEYSILFTGSNIKPISAGCCDMRLINEGDLNDDGTDELSVFQAPMNGCTYSMRTYSYINGSWEEILEMFLIPTACDNISNDDLQKRVFKENDTIYYYRNDFNEEQETLIKTIANTK